MDANSMNGLWWDQSAVHVMHERFKYASGYGVRLIRDRGAIGDVLHARIPISTLNGDSTTPSPRRHPYDARIVARMRGLFAVFPDASRRLATSSARLECFRPFT